MFFKAFLLLSLTVVSTSATAQSLNDGLFFEQEIQEFDTGLAQEEARQNEEEQRRLEEERVRLKSDIERYQRINESMQAELTKSRENLAAVQAEHYKESQTLDTLRKEHAETERAVERVAGELKVATELMDQQRKEMAQLRSSITQNRENRKRLIQRRDAAQVEYKRRAKSVENAKKHNEMLADDNKKLEAQVLSLEESVRLKEQQQKLSSL